MPAKVTAPQAFALYCEEHGWEAERVVENKGDTKRVVARKDGAVVTAEWYKGAALGPAIGHYTPAGESVAIPIKNQAAARRIIDGSSVPTPPKPKPVREASALPKPRKKRATDATGELVEVREVEQNIDWDPYEVEDEAILETVAGRRIYWQHQYGYETATVPRRFITKEILNKKTNKTRLVDFENKFLKITTSTSKETEGERILNFCDPLGGYRATFVAAIVRIE